MEHCPSRYQQHHRDGNLSPAKPGLCPDGTVKPPDPSFDAFLAGCLALCFAEVAGFFSRNGGPYLYAKAAFGDFGGYEVGVLKLVVTIIAWAAMAVGFATALGAAFPFLPATP